MAFFHKFSFYFCLRLFLSLLILLVVLGTFSKNQKSLLASFSVIKNLKNLVKSRKDNSASYLSGIKSTSYIILMISHAYVTLYYFPPKDSREIIEHQNSWLKNLAIKSAFGYLMFILVGTLLTTRACIKLINKWGIFYQKFNEHLFFEFILAKNSTFLCFMSFVTSLSCQQSHLC